VLVSEGESGEEMSPGARDKGALLAVGAGLVTMGVATIYSGNGAAKFAKICVIESGNLPYLLVAIPLGDSVNTREEVAALRVRNLS